MTKKQKATLAVDRLLSEYPDAVCTLLEEEPYKLLVAVRLAAQCTDARVNIITPALFEKFPTMEDIASADVRDIEELVRTCGFFRAKSRDIVLSAQMLISEFGGVIPDNMTDLLKLPGVGRKSANLILNDIYGKDAVVADTHCIRITGLLGLVDSKDPYKVEMQLRDCLPMDKAGDFCHALVYHGRAVCIARRPQCELCCLNDICSHYQNS